LPVDGGCQVAFAAIKAVGNSPARHRHIRKCKEFYRLNKGLFPEHIHLLFLFRSSVSDWPDFEQRLIALLSSVAGL
jgi:hypothetical protein